MITQRFEKKTLGLTLLAAFFIFILAPATPAYAQAATKAERIAPGVWKIRLGTPEKLSPVGLREAAPQTRGLQALGEVEQPPFDLSRITFIATPRGCVAVLPMTPQEHIYGFGLNFKVFDATGKRRVLRVSDLVVLSDQGDTHAPVPFYASTRGYGVFADTARNASFYCGNLVAPTEPPPAPAATTPAIATDTATLYKARATKVKVMTIEIPVARGLDLYVFGGPAMKTAIQRYNLFSGGGCLPPLWGLGVWYRGEAKFSQPDGIKMAESFRASHIPCDVFGLEPGWQTQAYSCSFLWSPERWPDPAAFGKRMAALGYRVNLWEHCFTHPTSPIHDALKPFSGDYPVWSGLVPDFATPQARQIFADHHAREMVQKAGISGFKLDECDNQPLGVTPWSFPDFAAFPSGLDGEQMHNMIGQLYQRTMNSIYKAAGRRTYGQVRASGALAAPEPFVLYSDYYDHKDYVRALVNSGFSGLLWQPEVRDSDSVADLYRRVQTVIFSPQALINAWYIKMPPWQQINRKKNNAGERMADWEKSEAVIRQLFELRMSLVPYLYSAFAQYRERGLPPVRALVMDWPADSQTYAVDDEYMMGDSLLVAPLFGAATTRKVYLPAGEWFDFYTHQKFRGGKTIEVQAPIERIPVFVKGGTLLPLAKPVEHIADDTRFEITVTAFGNAAAPTTLVEDDGVTTDFEKGKQNVLTLTWPASQPTGQITKTGGYDGSRYNIVSWKNATEK